jgi:hypothetical protein
MSSTMDIENNQPSFVVALKGQRIDNSSLVTTLESMPNEILMEIFNLFDWYSLYFSFSSLNSRFNAVLDYCHKICVDLDCIPSNKIISHLGRHLPSLDPLRIRSLQSSIKQHIKLVLRDDLILDHFSFIRSLTLINISEKTARLLWENPIYRLRTNLFYLFLSFVISNSWCLYLSIYLKLRQCFLPNATFCSDIIRIQPNTVQYLQISQLQSQIDVVATNLLVYSPHLRQLNLHVVADFTDSRSALRFIRPSSPPPSALTHLTVHSSLLFFSSIEWLLAYAPRLRTLHVKATSSCKRMINPSEWENFLPPGIRRLNVKIEVKKPATLPLQILKNDDFWLSRRWHVTSSIDPSPYLNMYS